MTPLALEMLIWACTRVSMDGYTNLDREPQQEILRDFYNAGIIDRGDVFGSATEKGQAWLKIIRETPMPVRQWADPRDGKAIETP